MRRSVTVDNQLVGNAPVVAKLTRGDVVRDIRPANTIMQVTRFIDAEWLVEIEADAVVSNEA